MIVLLLLPPWPWVSCYFAPLSTIPPPVGGSFLEYAQHDLIVNQSVLEVELPYLDQVSGKDDAPRHASPLFGTYPMHDVVLPPVCAIVSEQETVVQALQANYVPVTVGVLKYMFHVFCMQMIFRQYFLDLLLQSNI